MIIIYSTSKNEIKVREGRMKVELEPDEQN